MRTKWFVTVAGMLLLLVPGLIGTGQAQQTTPTTTPGKAIRGTLANYASTASSETVRQQLPQAAVASAPAQDIFPAAINENFDGVWPGPGWLLIDTSDGDGGEFLWAQKNCTAFSAPFSLWAGGGGAAGGNRVCFGPYPNNLITWAVYGPFSLKNALSAKLTYVATGKIAPLREDGCHDYFAPRFSTDGNNFPLLHPDNIVFCGDFSDGFYRDEVDLNKQLGQERVWIAFQLVSDADGSDNGFGVFIDNVALEVTTPGPVYLPLASNPLPTVVPLPAERCNDIEDNDTIKTAKELKTLGRDCQGSLEDDPVTEDDYYSFVLTPRQTVTFDLTNIPDGADYDLQLLNSAGAVLQQSANLGSASEHISFQEPSNRPKERHFIRVYLKAKSTKAPNTYALRTTLKNP